MEGQQKSESNKAKENISSNEAKIVLDQLKKRLEYIEDTVNTYGGLFTVSQCSSEIEDAKEDIKKLEDFITKVGTK
jgi:hypothetical protein